LSRNPRSSVRKANLAYAKVGTDDLPVPAKALYLRRLAVGVTGNPNIPDPLPAPAVLIAAADLLDERYNDAHAARLVSKTRTQALDDQSAAADLLVAQLASSVDAISAGNAAIIESAGFSTRATPTPVGQLPPPTDLRVAPSLYAGSADLRWKAVRGAVAYLIERAEDGLPLHYQFLGNSTKSRGTFNTMVSGKKYWFRVAAIGPEGQSAWSEPAFLYAP
jgi:hypothetical protein